MIDTSAVRASIGQSTSDHCRKFAEIASEGDLYGSIYVRMEFIRLWISQFIHMSLLIYHQKSVSDAVVVLEQEFSQRKNKASMAGIASFLQSIGPLQNTHQMANEFGRLSVLWLRKYDKTFTSRIDNKSKCTKGGVTLSVDYCKLLDDLQHFLESFSESVTSCEVNSYLNLNAKRSAASQVIEDDSLKNVSVIANLKAYRDDSVNIRCKECSKIGDAIIALEMPKSWTMIHTDKNMLKLCQSLEKANTYLPSVSAISKQKSESDISPPDDSSED